MRFNPAAFFVRRWQFTLVLFALFVLLGLNAFRAIPRTEDPQFPAAFMTVRTVMPGATPLEMEQLVSRPIEDALDGLDDVQEVRSTSGDGTSQVRVEFIWGVNSDRKYDEVVREVTALRSRLPAGVTRMDVQRARTIEVSIMQVALVSEQLPMRRLEKVADRLREAIQRVPGVRDANYWGVPPSEMGVALDLGRLAQLRLPASTVADALTRAGAEAPIGVVHAGERRLTVRQGGAFGSIAAVESVPVASRDGRVVHVRDVARVTWETVEAQHITRFGGKRAVLLSANQKQGADVTAITRDLRRTLDAFEKTLPGGVKLERAFFQADNVSHRLGGLTRDFVLALIIVAITLLPLGWRAAGVVMVSIPLSLLMGLALIHAFGFSLNQLSIAGFVLSLGLLVDDSIVVTENIARRLREGETRSEAAERGTGQIALAVIGCTGCLLLAFLPLMMLPGGPGTFIRSLPVAVLATVAASFIVSMTIVPFVASRLLSPSHDPEGNRLLRAINRAIHRLYRPMLHYGLERPRRTLVAILALCLLSVPMLGAIGTSLFPPAETPQFLIRVETPEGSSLAATDRAVAHVEKRLAREPGLAWYAANSGRGNPQLYYNTAQQEPAPNFGEVAAAFPEWHPGESGGRIAQLRRELAAYPGARISVHVFEQGAQTDAPVAIRISGPDLSTLKRLARSAESALQATPGLRDVGNPLRLDRTDLTLGIDETKAAALGVPAGDARRIARLALSGEQVARFRDGDGDDYPVTVRLPMEARNELAVLERIYAPGRDGAAVPLAAIAAPATAGGPPRIDRLNRDRMVTVTAYVQPGFLTSRVTEDARQRAERALTLPPGYRLSLGGEAEEQSESFAGLGAAIVIAILGILAVLVLEFGRFRTVAVVAGIIPLGLFGAVTALWLTGYSLSFTATIGLVALIGIEIKNSILLVDFTEQLRVEGLGMREAIERAGEVRFLPVLLTSVTAIGGLLPLAIEGSGLYSPLAIAIIGGLVSSTLLSRIATPVMYLLLAGRREEKPA
ncbi:efflux RND transporter permease subunit [Sphingomonas sp. DT-207]|uniref:efflux RND transporter permease subunit n=1 Tax=Sphingomonas sp. DT-207 TaxID=3396167 RepID=UPI003F1C050A